MSTDIIFRCSQCNKYKLPAEYGTRQKSSKHGPKGGRLLGCLSCSAANSASHKRKRAESKPDHPVKRVATQHVTSFSRLGADVAKHASASELECSRRISLDDHLAKRLATQPLASPSQFMEALAKCAPAAEMDDSWLVSVDEMTLPDKDIANHLASLVWKATGYRFRSGSALNICFAMYSSLRLVYIASTLHAKLLVVHLCGSPINVVRPEELRTTSPRNRK